LDANFGVFSVAHAARRTSIQFCCARRTRAVWPEVLRDGIDRALLETRCGGPENVRTCRRTRGARTFVVRRVQPNDSGAAFLLSFSPLCHRRWRYYDLYGQRWTIETDLRTLKSTLCLDQLTCATPDMVAKEIDMGITAYNLVRALMGVASQQSGIPPRGYSFTKVRRILEVFGPALANAPDQQSAQRILDQIMAYVQQSKLPQRKRRRPAYPRAVWKGAYFPSQEMTPMRQSKNGGISLKPPRPSPAPTLQMYHRIPTRLHQRVDLRLRHIELVVP
jgi:hypothetical protein